MCEYSICVFCSMFYYSSIGFDKNYDESIYKMQALKKALLIIYNIFSPFQSISVQ